MNLCPHCGIYCHGKSAFCTPPIQEKEIDKEDFNRKFMWARYGDDAGALLDDIRAADRDALIRAVEGLREIADKAHTENYRLAPNAYGTGVEKGSIEALDAVLALLHSPEKK